MESDIMNSQSNRNPLGRLNGHFFMKNSPTRILIHCSDVPSRIKGQFHSINVYHRDVRGFPKSTLGFYGGYHKLIEGGKMYIYRGDYEEGAHCNQLEDGISLNYQSIGLCWAGDGDIEFPSPEDTALLREQVQFYMRKYNIPPERVLPHRHYAKDKTCPGSLLSNEWVKSLTKSKDIIQEEKKKEIARIEGLLKRLQRQLVELLRKQKKHVR